MVRVHTHTHPNNGPMSRTTQVSRYQKGKTNLDFTGARDSEWQWHQLGHMQVCTSLQTDNHASTTPLRLPHQTRAESPVEKFKRLPGLSSIFNRATLRYPWLCLSVHLSVTDALPVTQPTVSKH